MTNPLRQVQDETVKITIERIKSFFSLIKRKLSNFQNS